MAGVTPTDRPKSILNRCVIEVLRGGFFVVTLPFIFFSGVVGAFFIGLSQISSFFSYPLCSGFFLFNCLTTVVTLIINTSYNLNICMLIKGRFLHEG